MAIKGRYITIQEWMLDLGLQGNELITFALVFGFSQDGESFYRGSLGYISKWLGVKTQTTRNILHRLVGTGLLVKDGGQLEGKPCSYKVSDKILAVAGGENLTTPSLKFKQGGGENLTTPSLKFNYPYNNTIDNKRYKNTNNKPSFIPPTVEQISEYARGRGFVDPDGFAKIFYDYYAEADKPWHQSNGKPVKDWKRAVITWEPNNKFREFSKTSPRKQPQTLTDIMRVRQEVYDKIDELYGNK